MSVLAGLRDDIAAAKAADEDICVQTLLARCTLSPKDRRTIEDAAVALVEATRENRADQSMLDAFLQEYGLANEEGVALMCLAEALLRVPDAATRDDLIADKISPGAWETHLGESNSMFVNASTWGLMLTGRLVSLDPAVQKNPVDWLAGLTGRLGEPVIRAAMVRAMRIMGSEFVLGETIEKAMQRAEAEFGAAQTCSFDMLGEGARTFADADRYFEAYAHAIERVGAADPDSAMHKRSGVSIKLSALHPRYEFANQAAVRAELGEKLISLCEMAAARNISVSIDAEEADRLDLSLDLFEHAAKAPGLADWQGLGFVVQAYGKRALSVIEWLGVLAHETRRQLSVRLVKGAYWDAEIKHAQELGLQDFPVFTRKATTDLSYLVCAQELMARRDRLFCQFATHNAHTMAAILHMANGNTDGVEFQRLHGMGEMVYARAKDQFKAFPPVRLYAPVGGYQDLLAYLVRRLLENGANSSFVNRVLNDAYPARAVVADPIKLVEGFAPKRHPMIALPADIFAPSRHNARGIDLTSGRDVKNIENAIKSIKSQTFDVGPLVPSLGAWAGSQYPIRNPANVQDQVGQVHNLQTDDIDFIFTQASKAQRGWNKRGGAARGALLQKAADLLETQTERFIGLLVREAGKSIPDALAEVREAVDFCRYYGAQCASEFEDPEYLPGPTGEDNCLQLEGRGVFLCISPWNFPLAIFLGQVSAALAAGNAVVAKPAEQTPIIAFEAVRLLHEAGVPEDVLLFAPGDGSVGAALVAHPAVAGVAFTGSTLTARHINRALADKEGPIVPLIAETGGQNVMFVDSTALLEQVTDDVINSAFNSAGQRCSALRVLYLQDEIADDALALICGAMDALRLGDPGRLETDIGPIIDEEAWRNLQSHIDAIGKTAKVSHTVALPALCGRGHFISPHLFEIGSITELTEEHFGPILHVIRYKARDLESVLDEAFSTGFGLTLGVHSRMQTRWQHIFERAPVGNVYVNRNMVGAVVGSQPFGGQGLSGTGFKAGGPRYLYRFAAEKSLSVNTMASGGNAELLTLEAG